MNKLLLPLAIVAVIAIYSCRFMPPKKKESYCAACRM